jgi:hypothetical protein
MSWYIIYIVRRVGDRLKYTAIDAIRCEMTTDAIRFADDHYTLQPGETFRADACLTGGERLSARALRKRSVYELHEEFEPWTWSDWHEFEAVQTYHGDPNQYRRRANK